MAKTEYDIYWEYAYHYRGLLHRRNGPAIKMKDEESLDRRKRGYYLYGDMIAWKQKSWKNHGMHI